MFFERSLQSQIIQEELKRPQIIPELKTKEPSFVDKTVDQAKGYFKLFLETSSIHGLNHLVAYGRHPLEIFLWLSTVIFSVFGTLYLSQTTWIRYQSSPTVVSMDRDMYAWNTTFPCVTVCPTDKLNMAKVKTFVRNFEYDEKNNISMNQLEKFIVSLANANYRTFKDVIDYDGIAPEIFMDLILNLSRTFDPSLTIGVSGIMLNIVPTITEMGLCYAVNSKIAIYNSPVYRKDNKWDLVETQNRTLYIHPLDGEVFAQVMNLSTGYDVYIHGPLEFPDISTKFQHSDEGYYMKLYVTAMTVYTAPDAAGLSVAQRRCRFPRENNLQHNSVYSYTLCRMECRIRLSLKHCGCVPHFYRTLEGEKICDVSGLKCLAQYEDELFMLQEKSGKKINCGCVPLCDDDNYVLQSNVLQKWFLGTNLQWGMVTYPRMRYRRDIIFGFTDVLVAVGGMAGLFLGCSVLSFMEIVYFLTLRLICYAREPAHL